MLHSHKCSTLEFADVKNLPKPKNLPYAQHFFDIIQKNLHYGYHKNQF